MRGQEEGEGAPLPQIKILSTPPVSVRIRVRFSVQDFRYSAIFAGNAVDIMLTTHDHANSSSLYITSSRKRFSSFDC